MRADHGGSITHATAQHLMMRGLIEPQAATSLTEQGRAVRSDALDEFARLQWAALLFYERFRRWAATIIG
jgi:hypothetical protein